MDVLIPAARTPVKGARGVPPSKSLWQRALALSALSDAPVRLLAEGGDGGEDVRRFAAALDRMGRWEGGALGRSRERFTLDLGRGATGFRFACALATLRPAGARTLVRGHVTLLQRPHGPLLRALRSLGGRVKRRRSGSVRIRGGGVVGREVLLRGEVSSQYASALLLLAPRVGGLRLRLAGRLVSRPYLLLTLEMLERFGVGVRATGLAGPGGEVEVAAGAPGAAEYRVEPDASSAAVWWTAAALTGGEVRVPGLPWTSRQADLALLPILERMGAEALAEPDGAIRVRGPGDLRAAGEVDLADAPDLLPLVGVLAAAASGGRTTVIGAGHARFKESDRLSTVAAGIRALSGQASVEEDRLVVDGGGLRGGAVRVAGDHRIALAFGALGLRLGGVTLVGAQAVAKSWPGFLAAVGAVPAGSPGGAARAGT